ncbi:hypothetical protein Tdes44962_MAKER06541 [Teratosphaeria destructans]|uniref:Uncharacterized protein n=1 Tax=Teratosphaeria destructans TaxID=418781 RepID=A0A9W7W731_9PEZI|nr:hypothetical protein Tdes44962_MAKER06541 [Teratosphaeria destructans]
MQAVMQSAEGDLDPMYAGLAQNTAKAISEGRAWSLQSSITKALDTPIAEKLGSRDELDADIRRLSAQRRAWMLDYCGEAHARGRKKGDRRVGQDERQLQSGLGKGDMAREWRPGRNV